MLCPGDFLGCPVVKTSPSNAGVMDSIPGQGAKIPHASQPKDQNIKNRSNVVTNSVKSLKMVHIKNILTKKRMLGPDPEMGNTALPSSHSS